MRICLYSPYLPDHFGGGERYFFDVARLLAKKHKVVVGLPAGQVKNWPEIRNRYERFLDVSLSDVEAVACPLTPGSRKSFWQKMWWTLRFDRFYLISDGSLFFSLAGKNIVHLQIPFTQPKEGFINRWKLSTWQVKNTNSLFTKKVIEKSWRTTVTHVHWPMITVGANDPHFKPSANGKEKIILSVGRFFKQLHSKRQDVLIELLRLLIQRHPEEAKGWKLVLVGGVEDKEYVKELKSRAEGLPVEFHHQVSRKELLSFYERASIYWHAAGFGIDEEVEPEKVEHFGISTVEAMAFGCFPLVHGKGGQLEVLGEELSELAWQSEAEAVEKTAQYLKSSSTRQKMIPQLLKRARFFNARRFENTLEEMIS